MDIVIIIINYFLLDIKYSFFCFFHNFAQILTISLSFFIDTTISSDTSDIEGRIGLLTEKLQKRRIEIERLKKEKKKQTKKQLLALEANLSNQLKVSVYWSV